ncbi:MAG: hypothetical protein ABSG90_11680 [Dehalococcoidia bacterium]|jgi:hypothetical protein
MAITGTAVVLIGATGGAQLSVTFVADMADVMASVASKTPMAVALEISDIAGWQAQMSCVPAADSAHAAAPTS